MLLSNGSIPDRALNLLAFASMIVFFMISFYRGICSQDKSFLAIAQNQKLFYIILIILSFCILTNRGSKEIAASLISAKPYSHIMEERESRMIAAQKNGTDSVAFPLIDSAMNTSIRLSTQKATIKEWMKKRPGLLCLTDDMADSNCRKMFQQYYLIRVVAVRK